MQPENTITYPSRIWTGKEFISNVNRERDSNSLTTLAVKDTNEVLGFEDGVSVQEMEHAINGDLYGKISEYKPSFYERTFRQPLAKLGMTMFQPHFITDVEPTADRAFATSLARGATADIFKPDFSDKEAQAYPNVALAGNLIGSIAVLKGVGTLLNAMKLPAFTEYASGLIANKLFRSGASVNIASKSLKVSGAAIHSAAVGGAYRGIAETSNEIRDKEHPELSKIGDAVLHDTLWWGAIGGITGPIASKAIGVSTAGGLGYVMAKADGASEPDALLNGGILAGFHIFSSQPKNENVRKKVIDHTEKMISDYLASKNPLMDENVTIQAAREKIQIAAEEALQSFKNKAEQGFPTFEGNKAVQEVLKSPEATQKLLENISSEVFASETLKEDVPRGTSDKTTPEEILPTLYDLRSKFEKSNKKEDIDKINELILKHENQPKEQSLKEIMTFKNSTEALIFGESIKNDPEAIGNLKKLVESDAAKKKELSDIGFDNLTPAQGKEFSELSSGSGQYLKEALERASGAEGPSKRKLSDELIQRNSIGDPKNPNEPYVKKTLEEAGLKLRSIAKGEDSLIKDDSTIWFDTPEGSTGAIEGSKLSAENLRNRNFGGKENADSIGEKINPESGQVNIPFAQKIGEITSPESLESIYQKTSNRFQSIENTVELAKKLGLVVKPGEDAGLSAARYLSNANQADNALRYGTFKITPEGKVEVTGEGLKPILDEFEKISTEKNVEIRQNDLKDYLIAKRTIEDLQRPKNEFTSENIVSAQQVGEAQNRISELNSKYGKEIKNFEDTANRIYDFQKRVLQSLVDSGILSKEQFDNILSKNPHYIPFDRILPEEQLAGGTPVNKKRFSGVSNPVKKIKGSELEIHDPIESIIKNTYRIMDAAARNKVFKDIYALKELPDLGIVEKKAPLIPHEIEHRAAVDSDYINQVKVFAEGLGATVKTEGRVGRRLGYYQPGTETAVRNFATPEEVISHEVGHFLDFKYKLKDKFYRRGDTKAVGDEIQQFMIDQGQSANRVKKVEERFAHAFEWWLSNRALAEKDIPLFSKAINKIISDTPELKPLLDIRPKPGLSIETMRDKIFLPSQFGPKGNIVEGRIDGKRTFLEVSKNLREAMTGLDEQSSGILIKMLSKPANWLRTGATITPEFMLRNPIRDQWTALLQTHIGFRPFIDPIGAMADIVGKTPAYNDWIRSGGSYSGFVELSRPALKKMASELIKDKSLMSRLNIIQSLQDISQFFEQATRLGVYKAAVRSGLNPVEASKQSRESTVDFARRGSKTRDINAVVAFFNASIQGFDKSVRTAVKDPAGLTAKAIATITIPSLLLYLANRNDPEYKEMPKWQKDLFFNLKIGGAWARIPKPFVYGQIFGSLPERFFEYLETKDSEAFNKIGDSLYNSLSPVSGDPVEGFLPTAVKPLIENKTNWSFFRQRQIVSDTKENLIPSQQFSQYDTETSKILGAIFNVSPSKIENLSQGYFGGSGRYALQGGDQLINLIKKFSGQELKEKKPTELSDIPLVKGFVQRNPLESPESLRNFYDNRAKIAQLNNTHKLFEKNGEKEKAKLIKKDHPEIKYADDFEDARRDISAINKKIDKISQSRIFSDDEKRKKTQSLLEERLSIAVKANKKLKRK